MCRVFCYITLMDKGANIALGFIPTVIAVWLLSILINFYDHIYFFILISLIVFITTGVILIRKERYKDIGIGVISGLIAYYLFLALIYYMMQGPM